MKVTLLNYTQQALELLIFTKQTRLRMSAQGLEEIEEWSMERKLQELEYVLHTIQSSWEFCDYTFMIEDVSRAFTHQLVRHRVGVSFAQQAQRAVHMEDFSYVTGPSAQQSAVYDQTMAMINEQYKQLLTAGVRAQDARGILPTNICTNIVMKVNLRSLHDMMLKRLCVKAQGEAQDIFREIRARVLEVHPWADPMLRVYCATTGTCCFPTFDGCPIKMIVYNPETCQAYDGGSLTSLNSIQQTWQHNRAEAQPEVPHE